MNRLAAALALAALAVASAAQEAPRLTGPTPFTQAPPAPPLPPPVRDDVRRQRNYPEQPPVIPHAIEGYEISINANKCMSCHARKFTEQSQAPMISITHFQDRQGNTLGGLAPRRFACTTCHVAQAQVAPLVGNTFVDMDDLGEADRRPRRQP
jgi:cytochrome c-type protein NapB